MKLVHTILFLCISGLGFSQEVNQFDTNGKRHGIWKKTFDNTNILRYEGAFKHGKEVGLFKFYKNINKKAVLTASKLFNESDGTAYVTFFTSKGKIISEGKMNGKIYVGLWKYYQRSTKTLLIKEHFNDKGHLEGERMVYYKNGQIAEKEEYKDGKLDGIAVSYSERSVKLKELIYVNGDLHGDSKYFNPKGALITEGAYKNGKKHGIWKFYKNGKLTEEKDFSYKPKYKKKAP